MFRVLLVLSTTYVVNSQPFCLLSYYENDAGLTKELNGTYYVIYTTTIVLNCEKSTWTIGEDNSLSVDIQSTGCCMQIRNVDSSKTAQFSYTVSPTASGCALASPEKATMKIIKKISYRGDACLIIAICRASRQGLLVMCRSQTHPSTLLDFIDDTLSSLFGLLLVPQLHKVNQIGCLRNNACVK